jgi:hypothetical protein
MQNIGHSFLDRAQRFLQRHGLASPSAHAAANLPPDAWELGGLAKMFILEPGAGAEFGQRFGNVTVLDFAGRNIRLAVGPDAQGGKGGQIHLVGGDQVLSANVLALLSSDKSTPVVIGPVERLVYESERSGKRELYDHMAGYDFGTDFSELPILVYDQGERRLQLVGGVYRVGRNQGVIN